jgi:DNA-binding LacI/PurR family transcriptional regulator
LTLRDGLSKHEAVRNHLAEQVAAGTLKPGDALPPELELAEAWGVARSTVRQALAALERDGLIRRVHGKGTFVHEQARQRPLRGLDLFALVLPETRTGFYPSLQHAFEQAAARRHHQMLVCCTDNNVDKQGNVILQLLDKQVGGVALVPAVSPPTPAYQVRQLQKNSIPVVFCHRPVEGVRAPLLAIPYEQMGRVAGEAMLRHGHRRAGFFSMQRSAAAQAYEAGLRAVLESAGGALPEEFVHRGTGGWVEIPEAEPEFARALEAMLSSPDRPTAIFASFDPLAEMLYLLLGRMGWRVPEDVSVVGIGGTLRHGALQHQLTSVTVDEVRIGRQAAELLDRMRRGELPLETDETELIPIGLSSGQTLGPAPQRLERPPRSARRASAS